MKKNQLYIEQRPQGDWAVRIPNSKRASAVESTQAKAEKRARQLNADAAIHLERSELTKRGKPPRWRKAEK